MGKIKVGVSQDNTLDENLKDGKKLKIKKYTMICIIAIVSLLGIFINYFNKTYIYTNKIAKNIFIEGVDVSNLTKNEAIKYVNKNIVPGNISLNYDGNIQKISGKMDSRRSF